MKLRRILAPALCLILFPVALSACALASTPKPPLSADEFWNGFGAVPAAEVSPAGSLDELVERSTLVVRGSIAGLAEGPVDVYALDEGEVTKPSTILTVVVSSVISGPPVKEVRIWLSQENPSVSGVEALPRAEFLWFLKPSDTTGLFLTTTLSGVIGVDSSGALATFRDRSGGEAIIPAGVRDLSELEVLAAKARS